MKIKLEHLLLLAGAVGVGVLIAKKRAAATQATAQASVIPPQARVAQIPSEDQEYFVDYVPVPAWGWSSGPGWWGGGWGGGGHHHGGHHGGHH